MTYAIIGNGGIGGYYGARLAAGGKEVHFLLRSDYEHVKAHGIRVESCKGDIYLPAVNAFRSGGSEQMPKVDIVLVCIKTTGNNQLPELLKPLLKEDSVVILIQNGLGMEEELSAALPETAIAGATAFICATRTAPGFISHTAYGELNMALYNGTIASMDASLKLNRVAEEFAECGVPCQISPSLTQLRWKKLVWNIPYNGMSVVENAMTDTMTFRPDLREKVKAMMMEVIEAGNACGAELEFSCADSMIALTEKMAPYYPSMYWDWKSHKAMELRAMYREPITEAQRHGTSMPLCLEMLEKLSMKEAELQVPGQCQQ